MCNVDVYLPGAGGEVGAGGGAAGLVVGLLQPIMLPTKAAASTKAISFFMSNVPFVLETNWKPFDPGELVTWSAWLSNRLVTIHP